MRILLAAALGVTLHAAAIRGMVVEDASGRPLARSLVVVQPIAGTGTHTQSVRANHNGQFEFAALPAGAYLVLVSRRGFAPVQYGQKQWKGSGVPVTLEADGAATLEIRLRRFGAVTGTVLDENDVGLPDHEVVIYRNTRPPALLARARTDDRGMYEFHGLEPGSYLVRTVGKRYDEGSYLPTFARQTARVNEAYPSEVVLDQEIERVDIHPFSGMLLPVVGRALTSPPGRVTVTLVSDAGIQSIGTDARGEFRFPPAPAGQYELYASGRGAAAYQPIYLERGRDFRLTLAPLPELSLRLEDPHGRPIDPQAVQILIRHRDLAGTGTPQTLRAPAALAPGRWQVALAPTPSYYAARFLGGRGARPDGWNEVELNTGTNAEIEFVLAPHAAAVHGVVQERGKPVAGVPVYLDAEGLDPRMTRTDTEGRYEFYGIAPGPYRVLATFDAFAGEAARAVELQEGQDQPLELALYHAQ